MESWKKAIKLDPDDELVGSTLTDGEKFIMLVSQSGKAVFLMKRKLDQWEGLLGELKESI